MIKISTTFAIEAENFLEKGDLESSIQICKLGLKLYPNYPTAISILAKSYYLNREYKLSKYIINKAKLRYPKNLVIINMSNWIEEQLMLNSYSSNNMIEELKINNSNIVETDELLLLSKSLENAKITPIIEDIEMIEEIRTEEIVLANETMAKILTKQEEYQKAIEIYNILIQKQKKPEKIYYFQKQIDNINELIKKSKLMED